MKNVVNPVIAVALGLVSILSSCEKEALQKKDMPVVTDRKDDNETGDNDSPIVIGFVVEDGTPVYPAEVHLFREGSIPEAADTTVTDPEGNFRFDPDTAGTYFLEVYQAGYLLQTSDTFNVTDSAYVVIEI